MLAGRLPRIGVVTSALHALWSRGLRTPAPLRYGVGMGVALVASLLRIALNPAWGTSYVVGVAPHGSEVSAIPGNLMMGRHWTGCYMGGARLSRLPEIVDWYVEKKIDLDSLVTHRLRLDQIGPGFEMMKRGESIRSVVVL